MVKTRSSTSNVSKANTRRTSKAPYDMASATASAITSAIPYVSATIKKSIKSKFIQPLSPVASSPVASSVTSSVVSHVTSPLPYIIYRSEGLYRPICVVHLKNSETWITPNISYYRSSGQSNDRFQQKYANSWLPCATILEDRATIGGKDLEKGFIFKMSSFLPEAFIGNWGCQILNVYFRKKYEADFPEYVEDILKTANRELNPNMDLIKKLQTNNNITNIEVYEIYKKLLEEYYEIHEFMSSYFLYDWQLAISAKAGGGYWQQNAEFHAYVLNELKEENFILPNFNIQEPSSTAANTDNLDEVVNFLKTNQCFPSVELLNIAADNYRKQEISTCSNLTKNKYIFVVRRLDQLYRAKAASDKYSIKGGSRKRKIRGKRRRISHKNI